MNRKLLLIIFFILAMILILLFAFTGQQVMKEVSFHVTGRVLDKSGAPASGVGTMLLLRPEEAASQDFLAAGFDGFANQPDAGIQAENPPAGAGGARSSVSNGQGEFYARASATYEGGGNPLSRLFSPQKHPFDRAWLVMVLPGGKVRVVELDTGGWQPAGKEYVSSPEKLPDITLSEIAPGADKTGVQ